MSRKGYIYLATPLTPEAAEWRGGVAQLLAAKGMEFYDPWTHEQGDDAQIATNDLAAVRDSRAVLAFLPEDAIIVGVFVELGYARAHHIPAVVQTTVPKYSERTMLRGLFHMASTTEEAVEWLSKN